MESTLKELITITQEIIMDKQQQGIDTHSDYAQLDKYQTQLDNYYDSQVNELRELQVYDSVNHVMPSKIADVVRHEKIQAINNPINWQTWAYNISLVDFDEFFTRYLKNLHSYKKLELLQNLKLDCNKSPYHEIAYEIILDEYNQIELNKPNWLKELTTISEVQI